jgi:dipeptidyl aminopeptidase/acylaminoacyl peptidase
VLTESFRNWVDAFQWASDSKSLYFSAPVEGDNPIFRVTLDSSSIQQVLVDRTIDSFELSPDNRRIIYTRRSVGDPVEIFAVDLAGGKSSTPQRLSHFNDEVANEVDMRPAERMWVKRADGAKIEVFHCQAPQLRSVQEISAHPQRARWAAVAVAGFFSR